MVFAYVFAAASALSELKDSVAEFEPMLMLNAPVILLVLCEPARSRVEE